MNTLSFDIGSEVVVIGKNQPKVEGVVEAIVSNSKYQLEVTVSSIVYSLKGVWPKNDILIMDKKAFYEIVKFQSVKVYASVISKKIPMVKNLLSSEQVLDIEMKLREIDSIMESCISDDNVEMRKRIKSHQSLWGHHQLSIDDIRSNEEIELFDDKFKKFEESVSDFLSKKHKS
jgi:hypothetical protein